MRHIAPLAFVATGLIALAGCGQTPTAGSTTADNAANAAQAAAEASAGAANASAQAATASASATSDAANAANAAQTAQAVDAASTSEAAAQVPLTSDFIDQAASAGRYEIAAARLALTRTSRPAIRDFAQMMIRDHTRMAMQLKTAAAGTGETINPSKALPPPLSADLAALRAAPPAAFDSAYVKQMIDSHEQALALMRAYAANGDTPDLKTFATAAAAVVRSHLASARALQGHP